MEEHDNTNPIASVDAIIDPKPLTIARVALLSRVNSPVLYGRADDSVKNLVALYLATVPIADAARHVKDDTLEETALAWAEERYQSAVAYKKEMCALLDAMTEFWNMLPSGDPKKKASDTETAG